jgi:mannitol/fructose-specific phosphotransferase system IIA component (Ntr-type)
MPYRFFNADETAEYLRLSRADLDRLVQAHELPFKTRGSRTVFLRCDLDDWASQRILSVGERRLAESHPHSSWQSTHALLPGDLLLPDLTCPEQIDPAMTAKTRASVLRDLVELAERTGRICDPSELVASLQAREALCSTAVPGGVAFLHPRVQKPYRFTASFLVLGRPVQPIHYGAPDGDPTDLFFLLGCQDDRLHLHTLARLCLMAQKTDLLVQLRAAADAPAMHACLIGAEQVMIGHASGGCARRGMSSVARCHR